MSNTNMEDIFKDYGSFEREPKNDRWAAISAELDKDKRRKAFWWWLVGGSAASLVAVLCFFALPNESDIASKSAKSPEVPMSEKIDAPLSTESKTLVSPKENMEDLILKNEVEQTAPNNASRVSIQKNQSESNPDKVTKKISAEPPVTEPKSSYQSNTVTLKNIPARAYSYSLNYIYPNSIVHPIQVLKTISNSSGGNQEGKFSPSWDIGVTFYAGYSKFMAEGPRSPASSGVISSELIDANTQLNKEINKGGYSIAEGINIAYRFHKNWSIISGLSLNQTTQNLKFNLSSTTDDPLNAPQDMPEGGYSSGGSYQLAFQRLSSGNQTGAINKYYGREIPLSIAYHKCLGEKFEFIASTGLSYRWISSGSLYLPDIDNVGVLLLNQPEDYPGIRSTWHGMASIGLSYTMTNGFSLQVLPQCKFGLSSNIRFERFVQQKQQEFGLQFKLIKNIRFKQ